MKILFLAASHSVHTVRWVNTLSDRGHEVHLVFCANHCEKEQSVLRPAVILHPLPFPAPLGYYLNALHLRSLFAKIQPDLCNAHYASGYGTLARMARLHPLVLSVWGSDIYSYPKKNRINFTIVRKNLLFADKVASTSHAMAKETKALCPEIKEEIGITPFGIDLSLFPYAEKPPLPEKKTLHIGTVKTLSSAYGIDTLLRVCAVLKERNRDVSFTFDVYGGGPDEATLRALGTELKLDDCLVWHGKIPYAEVPVALSQMDIFVCFSRSESFGVAAVEAMAVGLPVVATQADGFKEVIDDGKTGLLAPVDDVEALAQSVQRLIDSPALRASMGKAGRQRVETLYNWEDNVSTMEALYRDLLKA